MKIEVRDLSFSHGALQVLRGVSFVAQEGQMVALLGPNGAGKSTLFRCLLGLYRNYQGQALLEGQNAKDMERTALAKLAAYIPQSTQPIYNYTVMDTVLMGTTGQVGLLRSPGAAQKEMAYQMLKLLEIEKLAGRGVAKISGGERQLVLIARALAQNAKILIMDEPTANLDYGNQQRVLERVRGLAENGYTVLVSTHNPEHALRFSTHVLALHGGVICAAGTVREALDANLIRKLYDIDAVFAECTAPDGTAQRCICTSIPPRGKLAME